MIEVGVLASHFIEKSEKNKKFKFFKIRIGIIRTRPSISEALKEFPKYVNNEDKIFNCND